MAKTYGKIGFSKSMETDPGIYESSIVERFYTGDMISNYKKYENSGNTNDDLNISARISIVSDSFATENLHLMKYVELMGTKWKIINIEPLYPRLILTIGGVYNGE